jgi:hypothetical protein
MVVVVGNLQQSLARDVATTKDIFEEGHHVVRPFGAAKRNE